MEILSILLNRQAPLYLRLSILPAWPPRRHFCLLSVYLRLIQFPVCSDRPSEHPGARKAVMDELRGNSEIERGEERRSPPRKDLLQGCRMDEISLCISFSDCFSFRSSCPSCVKGRSTGWEMWWRSQQSYVVLTWVMLWSEPADRTAASLPNTFTMQDSDSRSGRSDEAATSVFQDGQNIWRYV